MSREKTKVVFETEAGDTEKTTFSSYNAAVRQIRDRMSDQEPWTPVVAYVKKADGTYEIWRQVKTVSVELDDPDADPEELEGVEFP